ncbi:hypothetical protein [Cellulomonas fimi]|uniref:Uncharacterized protein n=1 Tax=Cellulomonas fimi TaxID=1708 RepID=A0A7Y0LX31_CELFI|nr:hypothetical protein [Cellulomonas fimi]NMR19841.1 hypothetical protein [Cellulomonas fimi]
MTVPALDLALHDAALLSVAAEQTVATTATPSPTPEDGLRRDLDPQEVSPGLVGFVPVFLIALACIGLFLSLASKIRKVNRSPEPEEPGADGTPGAGPAGAGAPERTRPDDGAPRGPGR